jgi:hypothetical protein
MVGDVPATTACKNYRQSVSIAGDGNPAHTPRPDPNLIIPCVWGDPTNSRSLALILPVFSGVYEDRKVNSSKSP